MLHPVWPSLDFWSIIWLISPLPLFLSSTQVGFMKNSTGLVAAFLWSAVIFSCFLGTFVLYMLHISLQADPGTDRLFRGYERAGKTIGSVLLLLGNVGLYFYSEKSVACMLTFLFLAFYCLCAVFCIQPCTGFGVLEFLLSASLSQALSLFRLRFYTWLVLTACVLVAGVQYWLDPHQPHIIAASSSGIEEQQPAVLEAVEDGGLLELAANLSPSPTGTPPTGTVGNSLSEVDDLLMSEGESSFSEIGELGSR